MTDLTDELLAPAALPRVARVVVDSPLPHLDRLFDYAVPAELDEVACPGVRVKVRFSGRLVGGYLLERTDGTGHGGRLSPLSAVVSPERVLTPEVARLARAVADRYAGTMTDVLRLAIPPRHARVEKQLLEPVQVPAPPALTAAPRLDAYENGSAFRAALRDGKGPHAILTVAAGRDWTADLADAVRATVDGGRGAVIVVPDGRDVDRVDAALTEALGPGRHVALTADLGPAERYRRFLALVRGRVPVVVGTRAAAFAPVHDVGLVVVWDDGDDLHAEPRAPYPHVRDVLVQRAHLTGAALIIGGHAMTAESALLLESGWAAPADPTEGGGAARRRPRWSRSPRTLLSYGTLPRGQRASRPSPGRQRGSPSPRACQCWSRCRAVATSRASPAPTAAPPRGAPPAPDRCAEPTGRPSRPVAGAAGPRSTGPVLRAVTRGCAPSWSAPGGRRRNWAEPFRA